MKLEQNWILCGNASLWTSKSFVGGKIATTKWTQKREFKIKRRFILGINLPVEPSAYFIFYIESWLLGAGRPWVQWAEILPLNITAISTTQNIPKTYHIILSFSLSFTTISTTQNIPKTYHICIILSFSLSFMTLSITQNIPKTYHTCIIFSLQNHKRCPKMTKKKPKWQILPKMPQITENAKKSTENAKKLPKTKNYKKWLK